MKNRYKFPWNPEELAIKVNEYIKQYQLPLTVRQIFYRLVTEGLLNLPKVYKNLDKKLTTAREQDMIAWEDIIDLTRTLDGRSSWTSPQSFYETVKKAYNRNLLQDQASYIEIWAEKAVAITDIAEKYDIKYMLRGGYRSGSNLYEASERMRGITKPIIILYFGDFDPSGLDIERSLQEKMKIVFNLDITVKRVALNFPDIQKYNLSPNTNPKKKDPRWPEFKRRYGEKTYELDALPPTVLSQKIENSIRENIDIEKYNSQLEEEVEDRERISIDLENL